MTNNQTTIFILLLLKFIFPIGTSPSFITLEVDNHETFNYLNRHKISQLISQHNDKEIRTKTVKKDKVVSLHCITINLEKYIIAWFDMKKNLLISLNSDIVISDDPRYSIRIHKKIIDDGSNKNAIHITDHVLNIKESKERDAGIYKCFSNFDGPSQNYHLRKVIIETPPNITQTSIVIIKDGIHPIQISEHEETTKKTNNFDDKFNLEKNHLTSNDRLYEGNTVKLECSAHAYPSPRIVWRIIHTWTEFQLNHNHTRQYFNKLINLLDMKQFDNKLFSNIEPLANKRYLRHHSILSSFKNQRKISKFIKEGSELILQNVRSTDEYLWRSYPISSTISSVENAVDITDKFSNKLLQLFLPNNYDLLYHKLSTEIECIAENGVEPASSRSFRLHLIYKPKILDVNFKKTNFRRIFKKSVSSVILRCLSDGEPLPNVTWKRRYESGKVKTLDSLSTHIYKKNSDKKRMPHRILLTTHIILNISKDDIGEYECHAQNYEGITSKKLIMLLKDFPLLSTQIMDYSQLNYNPVFDFTNWEIGVDNKAQLLKESRSKHLPFYQTKKSLNSRTLLHFNSSPKLYSSFYLYFLIFIVKRMFMNFF